MERPTDGQVRDALETLVVTHHLTNIKALNYAVNYAAVGIELEGDELRIQCLYVLNNMSHWRGDDAKKVKAILKAYTKR